MTSPTSFSPVAIVAAECVLPGAESLDAFFDANESATCAIQPVPSEWWGEETLHDPDPMAPNKAYTDLAALIGPWKLNPADFKLPPRLMDSLDPVHSLAMELTRRVVAKVEAHAPLPRDETAIVIANVGGGAHTALDLHMHVDSQKWAHKAIGLMPDATLEVIEHERGILRDYPSNGEDMSVNSGSGTIGGRLSNYFGFRGPHYAVDGACASSMVALHSACIGLDQGTYDAALVGSFSKLLPEFHVINSKAHTLSAHGSFPFDERADGFVPGEGAIMVALMPLEAAHSAGHPVTAVIRSIGFSANGRLTAPWVPSLEGEILAVRRAFEDCDIDPATVDYVEAHGTSTHLGDGVEFECLSETYGRSDDQPRLPIGSVKSMIGHLIEGAGLAGVLRGLFVFQREKVPPTVGVDQPRADLPFAERGMELQREPAPVKAAQRPLRVGVSSFGYGGVNYHLLIESDNGKPAQPRSRRPPARDPIAIVGMGTVLPDAPDTDAFWENLSSGRVSSHDLRAHVPLLDLFLEPDAEQPRGIYVQRVAAAEDPERIDFPRFRIMPNRAPRLTKELVLLLEAASQAVDGLARGLDGVDLTRAGCIIGQIPDSDARGEGFASVRFPVWFNGLAKRLGGQIDADRLEEIREALWSDPDLGLSYMNEDSSTSGDGSMMASCIASGLDFRGKSFTVRAACATSMAALTLAAQELRQRTLDFVLCGATSSGIGLANEVVLTHIQALSRSGRTRPYDRDADGFILGSGAVMLALKRLSDAEENGDEILAVVRNVTGASDGKGTSLLAPNLSGRELVLKRAYELTDAPFASVQYVEGHGAATSVGDETEVAALASARNGGDPLYLGSVKGNVGHLKAAAGLAGLAKVVLALRHKTIPPAAGSQTANPSLRLRERGLITPSATLPWPTLPDQPRRAGVNSFGLAGSNYHALIEEYVPAGQRAKSTTARQSATSSASWSAGSEQQLATQLSSQPEGSLAAQAGARAAIVWGPDESEQPALRRRQLQAHLGAERQGRGRLAHPDVFCNVAGTPGGPVCFLFPGQGGQYGGMLRRMAAHEPFVGEIVAEAGAALAEEIPDFADRFWGSAALPAEPAADGWLEDTSHAQVATVLTSHVLTEWMARRDIRPQSLLGHSIGELSALSASNAVAFGDSLRIACWRGRIAKQLAGSEGQAMVAVAGPLREVSAAAAEVADAHVANLNSPGQTVVSGTQPAIEQLTEVARGRGLQVTLLPIELAFHSPLMAAMVDPLLERLREIEFRPPAITTYCSVTGRPYPVDAGAEQIREAIANLYTARVDYSSMVTDAHASGARTFVEVGPKRALVDLAKENLGNGQAEYVPLLHPKGGEDRHLTRAAARLWTLGLTDVRPEERTPEKPGVASRGPGSGCRALVPEVRPARAPGAGRDWRGARPLIVSDGSGLAEGLAERLRAEGAEPHGLTVLETVSESHTRRYGSPIRISDLGATTQGLPAPTSVYFLPAFDVRRHRTPADLHEVSLTNGSLATLRELLRALGDEWLEGEEAELTVVTRLDGVGGHTAGARSRPSGGALRGFLRALRREFPTLRCRALDLSPLATVLEAVDATLGIQGSRGGHVELGRLGDDWNQSVLVPAFESPEQLAASTADPPWTENGTILLTGGARGITAAVAGAINAARPAHLLLLGSTAPADPDDPLLSLGPAELDAEKIRRFQAAKRDDPGLTPVRFERDWKPVLHGLEVTRNIDALRASGANVEYARVDLTNAHSARSFVTSLRQRGARVEALIHGAGLERSMPVGQADAAAWDRTVAVKVAGLHHLLPLLGPETRAVLLFGSIAAAFGGHGQTSYCAANEYLSRFSAVLSARLPSTRVTTIAWPPWEEIGMAASRSSSRAFLEAHGIRYMSPREGTAWALASLCATAAPSELVILPPGAPDEIRETRNVDLSHPRSARAELALVSSVVPGEDGGHLVRWRFDPEAHAHLLEHRVGGKVRLPAAHLIEQMAEAFSAATASRSRLRLRELRIDQPLILAPERTRDIFVEVSPRAAGGEHRIRMWTYPALPDGTLVPRRLQVAEARVLGIDDSERGGERVELALGDAAQMDPAVLAAEFAKNGIEYGPRFQGIRQFASCPDFAYAAEIEPLHDTALTGSTFMDVPLLDLALQSLSRILIGTGGGLPVGIDQVDVLSRPEAEPTGRGWALGSGDGSDPESVGVLLVDDAGAALAQVRGIHLKQSIDAGAAPPAGDLADLVGAKPGLGT